MNRFTGDRTNASETRVSVSIGTGTHEFSVWCSKESANLLTLEDWAKAKERLDWFMKGAVQRAVMLGSYFDTLGQQTLRNQAERAMKNFIYEQLRRRNQTIGTEKWQVDSLLAGEEYAV